MAETVIFAEQTITFNAGGTYAFLVTVPRPIVNRAYRVVYNSVAYTCAGKLSKIGDVDYITLGGGYAGLTEMNEPFLIKVNLNYDLMTFECEDTSATSATLAISTTEPGSKIEIFAEETLSPWVYDSGYGAYSFHAPGGQFDITLGETYLVEWDGVGYDVVAQDASALTAGYVALGNAASMPGLSGNGEPFAIAWSTDIVSFLSTVDTDATDHTVAIYQYAVEEEEEPSEDDSTTDQGVGVILKDRDGNDKEYYGVRAVKLVTTDGGTQIFTKGEAVDNLPITLDFSSGTDQTVTAPDGVLVRSAVIQKPVDLSPENIRKGKEIAGVEGTLTGDSEEVIVDLSMIDGDQVIVPTVDDKLISKATVTKPETLIPENIAKDVNVGGIIGTYVGGSAINASEGTYTADGTGEMIVRHGLGLVPDLIQVYAQSYVSGTIRYVHGVSKELAAKTGLKPQSASPCGTTIVHLEYALGVDEKDESGFGYINSATPSVFRVGGATLKHAAGTVYTWKAVAGLVAHTEYFYIQLALDGHGNLIVAGGVPEIEYLEIYIDGVEKGTVKYEHDVTFTVDISSFTDKEQHTVSVIAVGEKLAELYPTIYYDDVTGYVNPPIILGVSGLYASTVALSRTDDAVGLSYTINSDGTITSDFNDLFPWSEAKLVSDSSGNQFVQMPEMWFRVGADADGCITDIAVSPAKHDEGEWYHVDSFCYGRYGGYVTSSKLCSKSGYTRTANYARSSFRTYARSNGSLYHQLDLYHHTVMNFLWWIEFATKDSMSIMTGRISGSGTSGGSTARATGGTNSLTTPSGYIKTYNQMRFHYIEDYIGNLMEWIDGVYATGYGATDADYVTSDISQYSDDQTGKTQTAYKNSGLGCIAAYGWDKNNPFLCTPTKSVANGNYNTYFCDYVLKNSSYPAVYTGAAYNGSTTYNGIAYYYGATSSSAYASIGARLMYKGKLS